jgi:hypothetical protein
VNVIILSASTDIAGVGNGLRQAISRHASGWAARSVTRRPSPYGYPTDIIWPPHTQPGPRLRRLVAQADVIHVLDSPMTLRAFEGWQGKPIILHHLGTRYRRDPDGMAARAASIGALELAGSFDLMLRPHVAWLPVPVDLDALLAMREARQAGPIRIVHAPTDRALKSTDVILAGLVDVAMRHAIEIDLVEGVPWRECLERKARADIVVDELTYGYGLNALEAWGLGVPVVSGIADDAVRSAMLAEFQELPFVEATAASLVEVVEGLVTDPAARSAAAVRGFRHASRFHRPAEVARRAILAYGLAAARVAA